MIQGLLPEIWITFSYSFSVLEGIPQTGKRKSSWVLADEAQLALSFAPGLFPAAEFAAHTSPAHMQSPPAAGTWCFPHKQTELMARKSTVNSETQSPTLQILLTQIH